jgi:hypothetical protein
VITPIGQDSRINPPVGPVDRGHAAERDAAPVSERAPIERVGAELGGLARLNGRPQGPLIKPCNEPPTTGDRTRPLGPRARPGGRPEITQPSAFKQSGPSPQLPGRTRLGQATPDVVSFLSPRQAAIWDLMRTGFRVKPEAIEKADNDALPAALLLSANRVPQSLEIGRPAPAVDLQRPNSLRSPTRQMQAQNAGGGRGTARIATGNLRDVLSPTH